MTLIQLHKRSQENEQGNMIKLVLNIERQAQWYSKYQREKWKSLRSQKIKCLFGSVCRQGLCTNLKLPVSLEKFVMFIVSQCSLNFNFGRTFFFLVFSFFSYDKVIALKMTICLLWHAITQLHSCITISG